ncbi:MAG TPA: aldo/keto reductase [Gemmatimonadales bacterium]
MQTRRIGSLDVTVIGLGGNNFGRRLDEEGTREVVHAALDAGIGFIDTADIYGGTLSEEYLGRLLGSLRDDVVLATKFGMAVDEERQGAHPDYVRRALEDSLRRLRTDRIDLYQLHRPDPDVPIADTLGVLDDLVREGKVREIGCSNFSTAQLREARQAVRPGGARFVSVQNEYSLLHRSPEGGMLEECRRSGTAFIPYFPLAGGLLTGKYRRGQAPPAGSRLATTPRTDVFDDDAMRIVEALRAFAERRGHTLLELAISWLLTREPVATVIAGATRPEQVRANVAAAGWRLSDQELAAVNGMTRETVRV